MIRLRRDRPGWRASERVRGKQITGERAPNSRRWTSHHKAPIVPNRYFRGKRINLAPIRFREIFQDPALPTRRRGIGKARKTENRSFSRTSAPTDRSPSRGGSLPHPVVARPARSGLIPAPGPGIILGSYRSNAGRWLIPPTRTLYGFVRGRDAFSERRWFVDYFCTSRRGGFA